MAAKKTTKTSGLPPIELPNNVFKSVTELNEAIALVAELRRERDVIASDYNDELSKIQVKMANAVDPFDRKIEHLASGIRFFADQNKSDLLKDDSKTVKFPAGTLSWRSQPLSVKTKSSPKLIDKILKKENKNEWWAKAIVTLSKVFIRVKLELDKDLCLKNKELAKRLGIEFNEPFDKFYIKPGELDEIEVVVKEAA